MTHLRKYKSIHHALCFSHSRVVGNPKCIGRHTAFCFASTYISQDIIILQTHSRLSKPFN
jgi:hypothetical protein